MRRKRQKEEEMERDRQAGSRVGSMSSCLEGGVIPPCRNVVTSNGVLMRLRKEDKN